MIRARFALVFLVAGACARPVVPAGRAPAASGPLAGWDSVTSTAVADGVTHVSARTDTGPWAVQVLEIDRARCRPTLRARKPGPPLVARATTSALAGDALAAINADFFMLPGGTPVGAHVEQGRVLAGPGRRVTLLISPDGFRAEHATLAGFAAEGLDSARIAQVNRPLAGDAQHDAPDALVLYTPWYGDTVAASGASPALRLRPLSERSAVVMGTDTAAVALGPASHAIRAGPAALGWLRRRAAGDTVVFGVGLIAADGTEVEEAVGGFPLLVRDGRNVVAEQPGIAASFGPARHPRTAVGWSVDRLLLVVVDGRQPGWSAGMSLDELADLMQRLGATDAVNLDGGGSSAMVVRGVVVNRPSDANGERAVGNALVLEACA